MRMVGEHPPEESTTITTVRVLPPNKLHLLHSIFGQVAVVRFTYEDGFRQSQSHNTVIGGKAFVGEELKVL